MRRGAGRRRWDVVKRSGGVRTRNRTEIGLQLQSLLLNYTQSATYTSSPVEIWSIVTVVEAKGSGQKRTWLRRAGGVGERAVDISGISTSPLLVRVCHGYWRLGGLGVFWGGSSRSREHAQRSATQLGCPAEGCGGLGTADVGSKEAEVQKRTAVNIASPDVRMLSVLVVARRCGEFVVIGCGRDGEGKGVGERGNQQQPEAQPRLSLASLCLVFARSSPEFSAPGRETLLCTALHFFLPARVCMEQGRRGGCIRST